MNWTIVLLVGVLLALLAAITGWVFLRVLLPLRTLARQASALSAGNLEAMESPCSGIAEIELLRRSMAGMAWHIRREQTQNRAFSDALSQGQEAERARLARELHDDTVQSLIAIGQSIDLARQFAAKEKTDRAEDLLKTARAQTVESANRLRQLIADLRPPALEELGLVTAIEMHMDALRDVRKKQKHDLTAKVKVSGQVRRLSPVQELALFRGVQEAATNAIRHGEADRLKVTLAYQPEQITVTVEDNGRGFRLAEGVAEREQWVAKGHYGLAGIRERMEQLGGRLELESATSAPGHTPGHGTTLRLVMPIHPLTHDAMPDSVRDPVCSAPLQPQQAYGSIEYKNQRYYFCCPVCQGAFQRDPEAYLSES
jgi:signal transduction histidine kinase/YHS domain-containing protein